LNCDEQYLPGTLAAVSAYFDNHPRVEAVFGDCVVVNAAGEFICYRKALLPSRLHVMVSHLPTFTCATFFRRSLIEKHGFFFDSKWRDLGDAEWVLRLLEAGIPMAVMRRFTSTFADTGNNMNLSPNAHREKQAMFDAAPAWARRLKSALVAQHRLRRLLGGVYSQKPFDYALYTPDSHAQRKTIHVSVPTFLWKSRM
jgi:hypothetical protein